MRESGVVESCKPVREDQNYLTVVRLDRSGERVEVRFPDAKRVGRAVTIKR